MIRILLSTRLGELRWTQADPRKTGIRPWATINDLYHEMAERINLEHLDLICEHWTVIYLTSLFEYRTRNPGSNHTNLERST